MAVPKPRRMPIRASLRAAHFDDEAQQALHEKMQPYLKDQALELAVALHRALGWPVAGVERHSPDKPETIVVEHAGVMAPGVWFFDARGKIGHAPIDQEYPDCSIVTYETEFDLRRLVRPIQEEKITAAGRLAMAVWPQLPWKEDTIIVQMNHFLDALEALSRRHGFWIKGKATPLSWTWPLVSIDDGQQTGYDLGVNDVGEYRINPRVKK